MRAHPGTPYNWSLQPTLHSVVSWQHLRVPELVKVHMVFKKAILFFLIVWNRDCPHHNVSLQREGRVDVKQQQQQQRCNNLFSHFDRQFNYWKSTNDQTEYVLHFGDIISFSGMKLIKNWFEMGYDGVIWTTADNQWAAPKWCLFSVSSPISFSHVTEPEAAVKLMCVCVLMCVFCGGRKERVDAAISDQYRKKVQTQTQ